MHARCRERCADGDGSEQRKQQQQQQKQQVQNQMMQGLARVNESESCDDEHDDDGAYACVRNVGADVNSHDCHVDDDDDVAVDHCH